VHGEAGARKTAQCIVSFSGLVDEWRLARSAADGWRWLAAARGSSRWCVGRFEVTDRSSSSYWRMPTSITSVSARHRRRRCRDERCLSAPANLQIARLQPASPDRLGHDVPGCPAVAYPSDSAVARVGFATDFFTLVDFPKNCA